MKKLDELGKVRGELDHEVKVDMLVDTLMRQLQGFERLMEVHADWVQSAVAYNLVAGLVEQIKYYAPAVYRSPGEMLDRERHPDRDNLNPKFGDIR